MANNLNNTKSSRTRSIVFCGLSVALIAVSAWISIPIGPVPITLQIFAVAFVLITLQAKEAMATIAVYLLMGTIGLPVFSSMRGGIAVLAGPTGGFLWGYIAGAVVALLILFLVKKYRAIGKEQTNRNSSIRPVPNAKQSNVSRIRPYLVDFLAALAFLLIAYICGWVQFVFVVGVSPEAAFMTAIAPFIILDVIKLVAAVLASAAVRSALR